MEEGDDHEDVQREREGRKEKSIPRVLLLQTKLLFVLLRVCKYIYTYVYVYIYIYKYEGKNA